MRERMCQQCFVLIMQIGHLNWLSLNANFIGWEWKEEYKGLSGTMNISQNFFFFFFDYLNFGCFVSSNSIYIKYDAVIIFSIWKDFRWFHEPNTTLFCESLFSLTPKPCFFCLPSFYFFSLSSTFKFQSLSKLFTSVWLWKGVVAS